MLSRRALILFILIFVCLAACSRSDAPAKKNTVNEENFLLIGIIPEENIFRQLDRYEPIAQYLSEKIGTRVKLIIIPVYGNIVNNFDSAGMDGAFLESLTYALAHTMLGVEVLCRPEGLDGTSTYHGLIVTRKDSGIKTVQDMKGKRFAFVDRASTSGYLLPLVVFKEKGIRSYKSFLGEIYYTGTYEDAIYDVLNKKADIGAAKNTVFERLAEKDSRIKNELSILERSPDFPENGFAVRKNLDDVLKKKIKAALIGMNNDPAGAAILAKFGARRFIETTDDDYKPIYEYARELGLDLAHYNFENAE